MNFDCTFLGSSSFKLVNDVKKIPYLHQTEKKSDTPCLYFSPRTIIYYAYLSRYINWNFILLILSDYANDQLPRWPFKEGEKYETLWKSSK